jgi:alpha-L-fucosidase
VNERDIARLMEFKKARDEAFRTNLANGQVTASNVRGAGKEYSAEKVLDGRSDTCWATDDGVTKASLEIDFGREIEFNRFVAQENIALGQRVKSFSVRIWKGEHYETIAQQTTIGYKRILMFPVVRTRKLQLVIEDSKASPMITNVEVFKAPGD